jgi:hypothetical protein
MSARRSGRLDRDRGADHGNGETERADSVGKGGAPGLAALPVDRSVAIDPFAEGNLKAGRNDLANGEAQGNLIAEAGHDRLGRGRRRVGLVDFGLRFAAGAGSRASISAAGCETITNSAFAEVTRPTVARIKQVKRMKPLLRA